MNWPRRGPAFLEIDPKKEVVVVKNGIKCPSFRDQIAEVYAVLDYHKFDGPEHS